MMDKRLLALVPGALRHVLLTVAWQFAGLVANVCFVWAVSTALATLVEGARLPLAQCGLLIAVGFAGRSLAARQAQRVSFEASADVKRITRRRIYEKLLRLGPRYADEIATAEVVQLSVEGCDQLETYFGQYLPQLFYSVLAPATLFCVVAPICLPAAIVLLVCVPLIPVVIVIIQKIAKRILAKYWDQYAALGDNFLENLQGLSTLKIYGADAARHEQMNREAEHFREVTMAVLSMQLNSIIVMDIVALGGAAAGISVALFAAARGAVDLFGAILIALLSADFFIPMRQLGSYFHVAMNGMAAADKIFRLLELPESQERTAEPEPGAHFSLHDVSFSYDGTREVLHRVSMDVPAVGLTAVVGESGSGKSTIAALLTGGEDGYEGAVCLGEEQVRDLDRAALARYVTLVGSAEFLFADTVRDNLMLAAPGATDDELWQALETAAQRSCRYRQEHAFKLHLWTMVLAVGPARRTLREGLAKRGCRKLADAMQARTYTTRWGAVCYWTDAAAGSGAPWLAFLPGLTADRRLFEDQLAYFSGRVNCLVWDPPAHGASRPFALDFTMDDMARILAGILDVGDIAHPVLVGQSMGGYVSQAFCDLFPRRAAGFVSIDSAPLKRRYYPTWEVKALRHTKWMYQAIPWSWLKPWGAWGTAVTPRARTQMRQFMDGYTKHEYVELAAFGYRLLADAVEANRAYELGCPAVLLCGVHDRAGDVKPFNRRWAKGEGLPLVWVPDAGHNSNVDNPAFVNAQIEAFLERL